MKFTLELSTALIGTATSILILAPHVSALEQSKIEQIAENITVRIDAQYPGSGVIVKRENDIYTVITAAHVVDTEDNYKVITPDNKSHTVNYNTIKRLPKIDAAILEFKSKQSYSVAKLTRYPSTNITLTQGYRGSIKPAIYAYGYPIAEEIITKNTPFFSPGNIENLSSDLGDGYSISYRNTTYAGMSGGPLLDNDGYVLGIHGRAYGTQVYDEETQDNWSIKIFPNAGVSINSLLNSSTEKGLDLDLSTKKTSLDWSKKSSIDNQIKNSYLPIAYPNTKTGKTLQLLYRARTSPNLNREERIELLNKALGISPDFYIAWFFKGYLTEYIDAEESLRSFDKAIELKPDFYLTWLLRAKMLAKLKRDPEEVLESYDQAIAATKNHPKYFQTLSLKAKGDYLALTLKKVDAGILVYDQALNILPHNTSIWSSRSSILFQAEKYEEAFKSYNNYLKIDPDSAITWSHKGSILTQLNRHKEAFKSYSEAIRIGESKRILSGFYSSRASSLEKLKQYDAAIADYDKSIELADQDIPMPTEWLAKASIQRQLERYAEAIQSYDSAYKEATELQEYNSETKDNKSNYFAHDIALYGRYSCLILMGQAQQAFNEIEDLFKVRIPGYKLLHDLRANFKRNSY